MTDLPAEAARVAGRRRAVQRWNADKPHRCPRCHTIAVDLERPRWWRTYTCCQCGTRFARHPRLAWLLPDAGVRCREHQAEPAIPDTTLRALIGKAQAEERRALADRALHGGLPVDMDEVRIIARYRRQGRQDAGAEIADLIEHVIGEYPGNGIPRPANGQGEPLTDLEWAAWLARNA